MFSICRTPVFFLGQFPPLQKAASGFSFHSGDKQLLIGSSPLLFSNMKRRSKGGTQNHKFIELGSHGQCL